MSAPSIAKIMSSSGAEIEKVIDSAGNIVYQKATPITPYLEFAGTNPFTLKTSDGKLWNGTIEYSTDKQTWTTWSGSSSTAISSSNAAPYVLYLRGRNNTHISATDENTYSAFVFTTSGTVSCIGDIRTLLDYTDPENTTMDADCFYRMFQGCTALTTAPALPATTLSAECYRGMFSGCTALTSAPALPATTLASICYGGMFEFCTSLTSAPELPATTLAQLCYSFMFQGCTALTSAPALSATALATACYYVMFQGCTSLASVPALPATTLTDGCYRGMFYNCPNIKLAEAQSGIYQTAYRIPATGTGTAGTDSLYEMFSYTGGTFTGTPTINQKYWTANTIV